jgi:hypothetical protein
MSVHDTLRWGNIEVLNFPTPPPEGSNLLTTQQIVAAHWDYPLTWCVQIALIPQFNPAESTAFLLTLNCILGTGQGQMQIPFQYPFAAPPYAPTFDQKFFPAQDLQISATLTGAFVTPSNSFQVGVFAAPFGGEPHVMKQILEHLRGDGRKGPQWMPPGFNPEPLEYR